MIALQFRSEGKIRGLSLPVIHSTLYLPTTPPWVFVYDKKQRLSPTLVIISSHLATLILQLLIINNGIRRDQRARGPPCCLAHH